MKKISDEALRILGSMKIDGDVARFPEELGQLERKLYLEVNQALEAIGGKWNRKQKGHIFETDPEDALDQIVTTGGFVDKKQELGFFETPVRIAEQLVDLAKIEKSARVLEPSAGRGRIAGMIRNKNGDAHVTAIEIDPRNVEHLTPLAGPLFRVVTGDFLDTYQMFDRVVMNPPFAKQADHLHVLHAYDQLTPGGRLVAIMSAGVRYRETNLSKMVRERIEFTKGEIIPLPEGSFKESGTMVQTVIVVLNKPKKG